MSASLVGSEMCIRDRSGRFGAQPPGKPQKVVSVGRKRNGRPVGLPPVNPCLLYTSDAADDM
eukprot:12138830-Alexandrium_andersonii.AAC.1